jgi:Mrp family chromosome partitioning ATPase
MKQLREDLQKQYDELKKKAASGKPVRKAVIDELERLKKEDAAIPGTIAVLSEELKEKKKAQIELVSLKREIGEKEDNVKLIWTRVQDFHSQLTDAAERSQDLNANDLRVHSLATSGATPYSTNAPKLGLALVAASALMFVGYMVLFGLPSSPGAAGAGTMAAAPGLQRALVALVPYIPGAKGRLAVAETAATPAAAENNSEHVPVAEPESAALAIADRIVQEGVDPGGIVLFAPTQEQLQVAPVIGDLGEFFSQRGDRVLVFDARHAAETPAWAGPSAPQVANTVEGYLDGRAETAAECFVPTAMNGVEYSRADLSSRVSGVLSAHRFRQLVEEMRERYSLVFLVAPPVSLDRADPILAMMAEGMVLVTETSANPVEVHAFLDTLCQQVPARLYGTLTVPRAA